MFAAQMLPRARERLATIGRAAPIRDAAELMSKPHTDIVVVCGEDGGMVGVVTKTDIVGQITDTEIVRCIVDAFAINSAIPADVTVEPLQEIWSVMKSRGLQRIPVLDENRKPVGVIYARDALQCLLGEVENDEALLRDYVMDVGYQ